jgi:hypothetical protein
MLVDAKCIFPAYVSSNRIHTAMTISSTIISPIPCLASLTVSIVFEKEDVDSQAEHFVAEANQAFRQKCAKR